MRYRYRRWFFTCFVFIMISGYIQAQTNDWKNMHLAKKSFARGDFSNAEIGYLKALKKSATNSRSHMALGDIYLAKKNPNLAMQHFETALKSEKNKQVRSCVYHNMGVINQLAAGNADKKLRQDLLKNAIECYKNALREFPKNDEARYNLVLCQKQLEKPENKQQEQPQTMQEDDLQIDQAQENMQTEQLLNLSRQAEKRAQSKINASQPKRRSKEKNW